MVEGIIAGVTFTVHNLRFYYHAIRQEQLAMGALVVAVGRDRNVLTEGEDDDWNDGLCGFMPTEE
jgi:hypothetical protein